MSASLRVDLPEFARAFCDRARARGVTVWLVGGTVRDALLGLPLRDVDLASSLSAEFVQDLVGDAREIEVDPLLGSCGWREAMAHGDVEVVHTALREEADYGPERRPRTVRFIADPLRDAVRRDFSVNALYSDASSGELLDPFGGVADLRAGRFRTIGVAVVRLQEDPLRVLRAARLEGRLGLHPMPATAAAMASCAALVAALVPQRRFAELDGLLGGSSAARGIERLLDTAALGFAVPALASRFDAVRSAVSNWQCGVPLDRVDAWERLIGEPSLADKALTELEAPRVLRRAVVDRLRPKPGPEFEIVTAADLIALGVAPGPALGAMLTELRRRLVSDGVVTRVAALDLARQLVERQVKRGPLETR